MDEGAINGAAIEAIKDLELDCEIKEVCKGGGEDEWCVQFSGKYGQFCDEFKNQFGKENGPELIREKIKRHLIKQVNKIRSSTGRKRRPATGEGSERRGTESDILTAPLKAVGEVFDQAAIITGQVIDRASAVADAARDVLASVAGGIGPAAIEAQSTPSENQKKASAPSGGRTVIAPKAKSIKAKKATKRAARGTGKKVKKASTPVRKTTRRTKKAVKKASQKTSRRKSG